MLVVTNPIQIKGEPNDTSRTNQQNCSIHYLYYVYVKYYYRQLLVDICSRMSYNMLVVTNPIKLKGRQDANHNQY
jgi:hypothetical protein